MTAIDLRPGRDGSRELRHSVALDALSESFGWILTTLREWRHRSCERVQLAALDDRMLRDIGLTQSDREFLANKPFWKE